ncbi:fibronectin type III domain-containing protein [Streptomyces albus]|uniref:fibronectin type III domain-containing protein n=1 Tax=Streptomyces albus TaxID=1888 RepID=UPI0004CB89BC|nr:fibronectin type III domain-containing protein [Streptomyces albus]
MRKKSHVLKHLRATAILLSIALPVGLVNLPATKAEAADKVRTPPAACAGMTAPGEDGNSVDDENHAAIRLDLPAPDEEVAVDEEGKIDLSGVLHKKASMVDVSMGKVVSADFTVGPPPDGVAGWASSWETRLRPPQLGENLVCTRAERDPKRFARILRSFTIVDRIAPSDVTGLSVGDVTHTSATASWDPATDNYGLAGYEIRVDGGPAIRTNSATRSYTMTGLPAESEHTVSVVAVDLAGNKSAVPATATFRTAETPPDPDPELTLDVEEGSALATWQPDPNGDVTYRAFLDGRLHDEFPMEQYCLDAEGEQADPCTADSVIEYPIEPLEAATSYTLRIEAVEEDGTQWRDFSGGFITKTVAPSVPDEVTQQVSSESSQCAAQGGDFYIAPSVRSAVTVPGGSTEVFPGCYTAADASCVEEHMPPEEDESFDCSDDVTGLLRDVSSPGGGPALSPLNPSPTSDTTPLFDPGNPVQPVAWCLQSGACTLLLAPPATAAAGAGVAATVSAVIFWVVVIAAAIVIGVALGVIWSIIDASPIAIGGLLEYPVDHATDFDTYEDWGLEEGRWYHSLTAYAQLIKTTKEIADEHQMPFAWTSTEDSYLRRTIDQACAALKQTGTSTAPCDDDFAVYVPGGKNHKFVDMQQTGDHIVAAMGNGGYPQPPGRIAWLAPGRSIDGQAARAAGHRRGWFNTLAFRPNACDNRGGQVCDEFPFWATDQAVNLSGLTADLKPVPRREANPQGNDISVFHSKCKVKNGEKFMVLPLKSWVSAGAPSFGIRVNGSGASVCMQPSP